MSNESRQKVFDAAREFSATADDGNLDTLRDALKEHDAADKPAPRKRTKLNAAASGGDTE